MLKYPQALQLLRQGKKIKRGSSIQTSWYLEFVTPGKLNIISNIPLIIRVQNDGTNRRTPWSPNTADILEAEYFLADGTEPKKIILDRGSWQEAVSFIYEGKKVRNRQWPANMHVTLMDNELRIVLANGTVTKGEYHPDPFDIIGSWEIFQTLPEIE